MNPAVSPRRETAEGEYQQLMHDIFHELSQPLSTLTCLIEVNLLVSRPAKRTRHDLQIALKQIHSVVRLFRSLRELLETSDPPQDRQVLSLTDCLREVVADFLPVALKRNVKLALLCGGNASSGKNLVSVQASRLRQGLLHLLEFALEGCPGGREIQVTSTADGEVARVLVAVPTVQPPEVVIAKAGAHGTSVASADDSMNVKQRELKRRLALAIARRSFEGAEGSLQVRNGANAICLEVRLPLVFLPR
jgi:signal transduction histidine kinase